MTSIVECIKLDCVGLQLTIFNVQEFWCSPRNDGDKKNLAMML